MNVSRSAFLSGLLEVTLLGGFLPSFGQQFTILTYGDLVDINFSEMLLPTGYSWSLADDGPTDSLVLTALFPGDFDGSGTVDDADLAVWEAGFGQPGGYTGTDFLVWQQNLGMSAPLGGAAAVPEAGAIVLGLLGFVLASRCRIGR